MAVRSLKLWEPLNPGDLVDVVAPGFAIPQDKLLGARLFLENLGLKARIPQDIFGSDILCSNSDAVRLRHLKQAFTSKDSKAVWCLRGGYGAIRILEGFSKIKKPTRNKLFVGYSDTTTLHNYINQFWGFATLHGPLLDRLGQNTLPQNQVSELAELVFGHRHKVAFENLKPLNEAARKKKRIKSCVVGGNLVVTEAHLGTSYMRAPRGQILFFEDIGERGYRVDRSLYHLQMAGYFKNILGIVFGEFVGGEETNGETLVPRVLERFAQEQKFPVFSGVEAGHGNSQRAVPLGTEAELICGERGTLHIHSGAHEL